MMHPAEPGRAAVCTFLGSRASAFCSASVAVPVHLGIASCHLRPLQSACPDKFQRGISSARGRHTVREQSCSRQCDCKVYLDMAFVY
jgi:hypothetical protein